MSDLTSLKSVIETARKTFTECLLQHLGDRPMPLGAYHRYLSMQYHLTKGVQRYFLAAAAHEDLARMRKLRRFLINFANEEELHYLVAANDLKEMDLAVMPAPVDVELWHVYFTQVVTTRPFLRLGAASVLENLASPDNRSVLRGILAAPYLTPANTKFLVLHMHETLPHGTQILDALDQAPLNSSHLADLADGARKGTVMYLRMAEWAINPRALSRLADVGGESALNAREREQISSFSMVDLEADPSCI